MQKIPRMGVATRYRRGLALATICASIFVISVDTTIVNVALPTLARTLHATNSRLQWIADAYTLVFAGLLLAAVAVAEERLLSACARSPSRRRSPRRPRPPRRSSRPARPWASARQ